MFGASDEHGYGRYSPLQYGASDEHGNGHQSLDAIAANRVSGYVFARLVDSDFLDGSDSDILDDNGNDFLDDTDSEFTDDTDSDFLDDSDFLGGTEWLSQ